MADFFHDTFTDTDDTLLSAHTPNTGTSWVKRFDDGSDADIQSNAVEGTGGLSDGFIYEANVTYPSEDYEVRVTIGNADTGDDTIHVIARYTDNNNMLAIRMNEDVFALHAKVAGTWTTVANWGGIDSFFPVDGDTVTLKVEGNTVKAFINGVEAASDYTITDTVLETGKAGFGMGGGSENFEPTDDVSTQSINEFKITQIGTPPTGTTGQIKVWNGSSWEAKPIKAWNGSTWETKPVKRWDGSAWVETPY